MPSLEAPNVELGSAPRTPSVTESPTPSEISSASSQEPPHIRPTPLFRALAMPPPEPEQPPGQEELERRLPGYRRIVIPRELTLIELLKQSSGVTTDEEVLQIREAKLLVVADRVGLRRLNVLAPLLRCLTLDGSAISSLRDLGIGLVHLKVLSVNRCGLKSLDGVWGLSALKEISAAGNRLQDLQPLAALQKLHTLNLADNPITDASRLWTLGVCGSLRHLTMRGTPAADEPHYRAQVATALPMLLYLDDRPLQNDVDYDSEGLFGVGSSDSGESDLELDAEAPPVEQLPAGPEPRPSTSEHQMEGSPTASVRRRPASTECGGERPRRPHLPLRPRTAIDRPSHAPSRLEILNTLMDEEWRCSGSSLTSQDAVCGNLTHALRRSTSAYKRGSNERELIKETLDDATRELAAEIPRAPKLEDWIKFKEDTGIEINIDFNDRPEFDAAKAIERLELIEKETFERFKRGNDGQAMGESSHGIGSFPTINFASIMADFESWKRSIAPTEPRDVDSLFSDFDVIERNENRSDNSESRLE